jgi:plasmid stability protein
MSDTMATLTIRNIPTRVLRALKALAEQRNTSVEREVRELLEEHAERAAVLTKIEASWSDQSRRPSAEEIDSWIAVGRD